MLFFLKTEDCINTERSLLNVKRKNYNNRDEWSLSILKK